MSVLTAVISLLFLAVAVTAPTISMGNEKKAPESPEVLREKWRAQIKARQQARQELSRKRQDMMHQMQEYRRQLDFLYRQMKAEREALQATRSQVMELRQKMQQLRLNPDRPQVPAAGQEPAAAPP